MIALSHDTFIRKQYVKPVSSKVQVPPLLRQRHNGLRSNLSLRTLLYNVSLHGRNLVGDTGDVFPPLFQVGYNIPCPPHFFLQVLYLEKFQKWKWRLQRFMWSAFHVRPVFPNHFLLEPPFLTNKFLSPPTMPSTDINTIFSYISLENLL